MTKIIVQKQMPFSRDRIWAALSDFANVMNFSPAVKNSYTHPGPHKGVGARRRCELAPFGSIDEEIIGWEENSTLRVNIYDGRGIPPMKDFYGQFQLDNAIDNTLVTFELGYRMKMGPIGWLMDNIMIKPQFRANAKKALIGLEHYVKTGQKVSGKQLKKAS